MNLIINIFSMMILINLMHLEYKLRKRNKLFIKINLIFIYLIASFFIINFLIKYFSDSFNYIELGNFIYSLLFQDLFIGFKSIISDYINSNTVELNLNVIKYQYSFSFSILLSTLMFREMVYTFVFYNKLIRQKYPFVFQYSKWNKKIYMSALLFMIYYLLFTGNYSLACGKDLTCFSYISINSILYTYSFIIFLIFTILALYLMEYVDKINIAKYENE